ncbi:bifunctional phosphopantothenoylcysteine decarboxylase/phosphopantothenate synthase [Novosphingobium aquimarinum]|uniref:bifunctional phosphopantothenoylcysteine decarboxylase/phosphopantothenate synthase n=1 Tax=Novosphingobium aquimarinum TaxID=2682494 RepID=UPI0012EB2DAE|nr:bifunctional phosphopantothenoylcysteine decarboxylase/phosphopantothenate synthase [Novosphingobium aquimarinum]
MTGPRVLLVVGGGIAAYKACELVRTIRKGGGDVTCVLTKGGAQFVTPMALAALSENPVYTSLWDLKDETEMGHIQLSRQADLIVVCPATADLLAKMAAGIADDLATTMLLATDKPVMAVPAMNVRMWQHAATMRNVDVLREAGIDVMQPDEGAMACGEYGPGRLPEPIAIWQRMSWALGLDPVEVAPLPGSTPALSDQSGTYDPLALPLGFDRPVRDAQDEDEDEDDGGLDIGLGGLAGSLIARGIDKARQAAGLDDRGEAQSQDMPEPPEDEPVEMTPEMLARAGSLLSKKGTARSAPPTDPQAINHLVVGDRSAPPEPIEGEAEDAFPTDPLAGQPEFETDPAHRPLYGRHVLVTAGPTWEPIDPVRYIANRSSGKQGFAIAAAAAAAGARVTLVAGPVHLATPPGVDRIDVESAREMADAVKAALPADIAVMVAAVADWRAADVAGSKIKKRGSAPPALLLTENPDILAGVAGRPDRPTLLIGFAAETDDVIKYAKDKRKRKGVDWIIANDVSGDVMGGDANSVHIVTGTGVTSLPEMPKDEVATILVERMADALAG